MREDYEAESASQEVVLTLIDNDDVQGLRAFMELHPNYLNGIGDRSTPLEMAAGFGSKDVVELLLQLGADVNKSADRTSELPLMRACRRGDPEIVDVLLVHGANPQVKDRDNSTPLCQAARALEKKAWPVVKRLLQEPGVELDLNSAIELRSLADTRRILEGDPDAIAHALRPDDLVCAAVKTNSLALVQCAVEHGANIDRIGLSGVPALFYAVTDRVDIEILKYLLEKGANIHAQDWEGSTVFDAESQDPGWIPEERLRLLKQYSKK